MDDDEVDDMVERMIKRDETRFSDGFRDASLEDLEHVVRAALRLVKNLYGGEDTTASLFRLRKSLEGIWDHGLPEVSVWSVSMHNRCNKLTANPPE